MQTLKKHDRQGVSQFELTQNLLHNLSQFEITPTAKLVLLYLSSCYNPKKADVFPKQKTIAVKTGVSERSVVRAISELVKAGLILIECKYTNRYKLTPNFLSSLGISGVFLSSDILADCEGQNVRQEGDKLSLAHVHEPKRETNKEQNKGFCLKQSNSYERGRFEELNNYKILKNYAEKYGADNVNAYVRHLKNKGADKQIIADFKEKQAIERYWAKQAQKSAIYAKELREAESSDPKECRAWVEFRKRLKG